MSNLFILTGSLNSGKTSYVQSLFQNLKIHKPHIRISGFTQKGVLDPNDEMKIGYDLILLPNFQKQYKLARLRVNESHQVLSKEKRLVRNPRHRFNFDDANLKMVKDYMLQRIGKTDLWVFDELGKLEILKDGHYQAVRQILEQEKKMNSNCSFLFASREEFIQKILGSLPFPNNFQKLQFPCLGSDYAKFQSSLFSNL
ncbi:cancer-related nucleoside-triphosphatase [Anaeramoeba flamelloides]|uniref:Cancer-related nucleoside-triphosphatase n=1 Tax=Anaeramoeba flamelloides TaxID=1746091 RepID=A0AAV7ZXX8_9EUKA|nr:cancer-related nucleoside-triphosphatase [Anaeramoeba flamelloides]